MAARIISLGILALSGILTFQAPAWGQQDGSKPAAVVDGEPIYYSEIDAVLKLRAPTSATEVQRRQMQMEVLGVMIDEVLMQHFLRREGPRIDVQIVNKQIGELEASLKAEGKGLTEFCHMTWQNEAKLRNTIVKNAQWAAYVKERISASDLRRYYDENKDYFDQVSVRASHIWLRLSPSASESERQQARTKLQGIRQEILASKLDFAAAAKKYSQCETATSGGDLGYFPRKFVIEDALARPAFALKVDEVSDVVQTEYGMHLLKVTDRKANGPASTFERIQEDVREALSTDLYFAILAQQHKTAKIEIKTGG